MEDEVDAVGVSLRLRLRLRLCAFLLVVLVEKKVEGWGNRHVTCIFGCWMGESEGEEEDGEVEADDMHKVGDQVDAEEEDYGARQMEKWCSRRAVEAPSGGEPLSMSSLRPPLRINTRDICIRRLDKYRQSPVHYISLLFSSVSAVVCCGINFYYLDLAQKSKVRLIFSQRRDQISKQIYDRGN
ncbi:hypothetical protein TRV_00281 [Trichophyton verrucosum HKI 0517]|uniref:Uncharacterized protein n=1 Tax=Trichophyton verrucosum (strain HKI 0517) TaxID=663202 RepID=D4CZN9_TRIVH|nr:uncharacterized protein TRV_00281 [Trichophyton verrucosum HKI 0517]EFE44908.1 hypothetical protein TRV_00281 [Trichophyton verrucosum HKI 0517]